MVFSEDYERVLDENYKLKAQLQIATEALREIEKQHVAGCRANDHTIAFKALNALDSK